MFGVQFMIVDIVWGANMGLSLSVSLSVSLSLSLSLSLSNSISISLSLLSFLVKLVWRGLSHPDWMRDSGIAGF